MQPPPGQVQFREGSCDACREVARRWRAAPDVWTGTARTATPAGWVAKSDWGQLHRRGSPRHASTPPAWPPPGRTNPAAPNLDALPLPARSSGCPEGLPLVQDLARLTRRPRWQGRRSPWNYGGEGSERLGHPDEVHKTPPGPPLGVTRISRRRGRDEKSPARGSHATDDVEISIRNYLCLKALPLLHLRCTSSSPSRRTACTRSRSPPRSTPCRSSPDSCSGRTSTGIPGGSRARTRLFR